MLTIHNNSLTTINLPYPLSRMYIPESWMALCHKTLNPEHLGVLLSVKLLREPDWQSV